MNFVAAAACRHDDQSQLLVMPIKAEIKTLM